MDYNDMEKEFAQHSIQLKKLIHQDLPKKIGNLAVSLFKRNFREGGFFGEKWVPAKREGAGSGAGARRITLTGSGDLGRSIQYEPGDGEVRVFSDLEYSRIHNEGGETHPTVTKKMRRFAWAMFYKNGGKKAAEADGEAKFWKSIAITKQNTLTIKIVKRQFLGYHDKLQQAIEDKVQTEVNKALNID